MDRANVDTDQIIPKQFLKRIERTGFGQFLFFDWRFRDDGSPNPEFELNRPELRGASVLLARRNFGCGSSREHAPWALEDYGFRVIIAPSFADIFYNNCFKNGMLPIRLDEEQVDELFRRAAKHAGYELTVDLETCTLTDDARPVADVRSRAVPPPLPAQRPGRHRPDAGARRQDRRLRTPRTPPECSVRNSAAAKDRYASMQRFPLTIVVAGLGAGTVIRFAAQSTDRRVG